VSGPAIEGDLNGIITAAVQARVEAEVTRALAGDEVIGQMVGRALVAPVMVKSGYRETPVNFLNHTLMTTFQELTKRVVVQVLEEERPQIEAQVREALRAKTAEFAEVMTQQVVDAARKPYGVQVALRMPGD
jgi:TPP-dependent indolepyruvate ferredoxin oxidoreductase alpha subunit